MAPLQDTSTIYLAQSPIPKALPDASPEPIVTLLLLGFVIGILGHLFRSRFVVALGVLLIATATVVLPLVVLFSR